MTAYEFISLFIALLALCTGVLTLICAVLSLIIAFLSYHKTFIKGKRKKKKIKMPTLLQPGWAPLVF
jgi:flagellar biosynthesis component FlhA